VKASHASIGAAVGLHRPTDHPVRRVLERHPSGRRDQRHFEETGSRKPAKSWAILGPIREQLMA
jgi:hypothetical protein